MKGYRDLLAGLFGSYPQPSAVKVDVLPFGIYYVIQAESGEIAEQNKTLPNVI